jgi:hypothetical protein
VAADQEFRSWKKNLDEHPELLFRERGSMYAKFMQPNVEMMMDSYLKDRKCSDFFLMLCVVRSECVKGFLCRALVASLLAPTDAFIDPDLRPTPHLGWLCAPPRILSLALHLGFDPSVWVLTSPSRILHCVTTRSIVVVNTPSYQEKTPFFSLNQWGKMT